MVCIFLEMKHALFFSLVLMSGFLLNAQSQLKILRGNIISLDSLKPVVNAHIISELSLIGTVSDDNGDFKIHVYPVDTLRISCVGFVSSLVPIDGNSRTCDTLSVVLQVDNIVLNEVEVLPYFDYATLKQMVKEMPVQKPMQIKGINDNADVDMFYKKPSKASPPASIDNPVQLIYNKFNKKAKRDRRLIRNRKRLNKVLQKEGKSDSLVPLNLDFR